MIIYQHIFLSTHTKSLTKTPTQLAALSSSHRVYIGPDFIDYFLCPYIIIKHHCHHHFDNNKQSYNHNNGNLHIRNIIFQKYINKCIYIEMDRNPQKHIEFHNIYCCCCMLLCILLINQRTGFTRVMFVLLKRKEAPSGSNCLGNSMDVSSLFLIALHSFWVDFFHG